MTPKPRRDEAVGAWARADLRPLRATLIATLAAMGEDSPDRHVAIHAAGDRDECDMLLDFDGHVADLEALREDGAPVLRMVTQVGSLFAARIRTGYLLRQLDELERWNDAGAPPPDKASGDSLAGLVAAGAIRRASLGRGARLAGDGARGGQDARIPPRRAARAEDAPLGAGVTLGIVDTVFDYAHVAMLPFGQTLEAPPPPNPDLRIGLLFDPYAAQQGVARFGASYDTQALAQDLAACLGAQDDRPLSLAQRDAAAGGDTEATRRQLFAQHGTFTAGIAGGSGNASVEGRYQGIAPAARLAFAIAGIQDNAVLADSLDVLAAVNRLVEDSGTPLALLLNNGDCLGAHDGTLLGELLLDELLLHPGRAIVLPAGNQNAGNTELIGAGKTRIAPHLAIAGSVTQPRTERIGFTYTTRASKADTIEIWFQASGMPTASITMEPGGPPIEPLSGHEGRPMRVLSLLGGDARMVLIVELGPGAEPNLWRLRVSMLPVRGPMPVDRIRFELTRVIGEVHAWCDWNNATQRDWTEPATGRQDDVTTLTTPATAHRVIVAGECADGPMGFQPAEPSGRGPTRDGRPKPDVVALGAALAAPVPQRSPMAHRNLAAAFAAKPEQLERFAYATTPGGTSFSAPQVAGLAALLFEKWPDATWADIRQAMVEAALRPEQWKPSSAGQVVEFPGAQDDPPEAGLRTFGWDRALGYGRIDVGRTLAPPPPTFDVFLRKSADDDGREPYAAATLWSSPDIVVTGPHRLSVGTAQRGQRPVDGPARLFLFHAPFGALHPLPRIDGIPVPDSPWQSLLTSGSGGTGSVAVTAGDVAAVETRADVDLMDGTARSILAVLHHDQDPYELSATLGMRNNVAAVSVSVAPLSDGAVAGMPPVTILGTDDVDSLSLWTENLDARLEVSGIPVTALPWRTMRLFLDDGRLRSWTRPYFGQRDAATQDPANWLAEASDAGASPDAATGIARLTGVVGAARLALHPRDADGFRRLDISAAQDRLWIPRLRLAQGQPLMLQVRLNDAHLRDAGRPGWVHMGHFSGGRRVGGASMRIVPLPG